MHVIALDRELQHAEHLMRCRREGGSDGAEHTIRTQRRQVCARPQGDMSRAARVVNAATAVRDATSARSGLPPAPSRAPPRVGGVEPEIQLSGAALHLIGQ
jgi:hypothetical protein